MTQEKQFINFEFLTHLVRTDVEALRRHFNWCVYSIQGNEQPLSCPAVLSGRTTSVKHLGAVIIRYFMDEGNRGRAAGKNGGPKNQSRPDLSPFLFPYSSLIPNLKRKNNNFSTLIYRVIYCKIFESSIFSSCWSEWWTIRTQTWSISGVSWAVRMTISVAIFSV